MQENEAASIAIHLSSLAFSVENERSVPIFVDIFQKSTRAEKNGTAVVQIKINHGHRQLLNSGYCLTAASANIGIIPAQTIIPQIPVPKVISFSHFDNVVCFIGSDPLFVVLVHLHYITFIYVSQVKFVVIR